MDPTTRHGIARHLASLLREGRSRGSLLTLIGLDLVAFGAAATMAVIVPDAFDAAASSANESAFVFPVTVRNLPAPDVLRVGVVEAR